MLEKLTMVFLLAMLPVIELRGAIPYGTASELDFWWTYFAAVAGNILPVPFLIKFSKSALNFLSKSPKIGMLFQKIIDKADEKALSFGKYELLGIFVFVAIPLPGTGAWTASLIAAILRLRLLPALLAVTLGVMFSGVIIGILSHGIFNVILV